MIDWNSIKHELEGVKFGLDKLSESFEHDFARHDSIVEIKSKKAYQLLYYKPKKKLSKSNIQPLQAMLLVYSWVNSADILDFSEECSLVKMYQSLGFDVFLLKWKLSDLTVDEQVLENYYNHYLQDSVQALLDKSYKKIHVTGICQGGVFALSYAALNPEKIDSVTLMMAPIDSSNRDNLINKLGSKLCNLMNGHEMIHGCYLHNFFSILKPSQYYYGRIIDAVSQTNFSDYRKLDVWLNQTPDIPLKLIKDFMRVFINDNVLMIGEGGDKKNRINLKNIDCPVINIFAEFDRLVEPKSSRSFAKLLNNKYHELVIQGGHLSLLTDKKNLGIVKGFLSSIYSY